MRKITFLKATFSFCMLLFSSVAAIAQLSVVTSSGLPNIGRGQIKFSDFNNDGKLDALVIGQTTAYSAVGGKIGLYLGNGDGTFTDATTTWFPTTPTAVNCGMLAVADYDKDGNVDFCYAGRTDAGSNVIYLYKNSGTSFSDNSTTAFTGTTAPTGCYTGSIQWGDIDNDGDLDLMICGRTYTALTYPTSSGSPRGGVLQVYKNNNNGTFTQSLLNTGIGVCYGQALFVDFENDGDLDIYYSGGGNIGGYMINDGTGTYGSTVSNNTTRASNMVIADFNKDGISDLLQSYTNTSSTPAPAFRILKNTSAGSTITLTGTSLSATYGVGGTAALTNMGMLSAIDYDADGDLDFTIQGAASATTPTTSLFLNDGTATFTDAAAGLPGLHYGGAEWADLNNDGKPDFVFFGYSDQAASTAATYVYLNGTSTANTAPSAPTSINVTPGSVATLSWTMPNNADDHTANINLTYNVRIGTSTGSSNILKANVYGPGKYNLTSASVKGLADGNYYWSVQAVDAANVAGAWATEGTFTIGNPTTIPTVQATNVSATSSTQTTLTLNWTNGDGYKTAVFVKTGSSSLDLASPATNTVYTANTTFGSGTQIGTSGWYCVYNNSITPSGTSSVTVTGLSALTSYQVMAVSYNSNSDNSIVNYLTTSSTANPSVISTADFTTPTITTSALTVTTNTTSTTVDITPSQTGTGYNVNYSTVVFIKQGSDSNEDVTLSSNTTYSGNLAFGSGAQVGTTGWYCVYNGLSSYKGSGAFNPFSTFTNLQPNTSYQVRACTYNGTAGLEKYSATAGVVFTTPINNVTSLNENIENPFNIYPSLSSGLITINGVNCKKAVIFNIAGQAVKQVNNLSASNSVNISDLSNGAYLVKVQFADGSAKTQRILLQK